MITSAGRNKMIISPAVKKPKPVTPSDKANGDGTSFEIKVKDNDQNRKR